MPDVNVLVGAYRTDAAHHRPLKSWLADAVSDLEPVGLTDAVLAGYVRVVTHPRVFDVPTPIEEAMTHVRALLDDDGTTRVVPGSLFPREFERLCLAVGARGNLVSDAAHAAVAIEAGATWYSRDRDFARFPGLRWRLPDR
ncbi:MAG: TA system VapC family ribonuclease toxin [Dermatophilaceae bacterium]